MATSAETPIAKPNQAARRAHEQFLDRHRPVLLRHLDRMASGSEQNADALGYVEAVLEEWHELFGQSGLADATPEESTFWYALYQLEELAELPAPRVAPYEKLLMENLVEVRELLRHRRPLPEDRFMATRPDGT